MTETCDVDGCTSNAVADMVGTDDGLRCRGCLETDLGLGNVGVKR